MNNIYLTQIFEFITKRVLLTSTRHTMQCGYIHFHMRINSISSADRFDKTFNGV
jgi:hypothetical protein